MTRNIQDLLRQASAVDDGTTSVTTASREFSGEPAARKFFGDLTTRLLDIGQWHSNAPASSYELFTSYGEPISERPIEEGNFIRLNIYGSGKFDWVKVFKIDRLDDEIIMTVGPSFDPTAEPRRPDVISHFFHSDARNNFCANVDGKTVNFFVIGLNERQNVSETSGVIESVRNAAAANTGYYLGIQKGIWKSFCRNFLCLD